MAGPLLARAKARGERAVVAVVTNGDAACKTSGFVRERETLEAMAIVGVPREHVHFLGYPDGAVELLAKEPRATRRLSAQGLCVEGSTTYASEQDGMHTVASVRASAEQPYVREALLDDLAWLLATYRPARVVTAHPDDDHPDHAATGLAVLGAIARAAAPTPRLSFSFVHLGADYPSDDGVGTRGIARSHEPTRRLPEEFQAIEPEERVAWAEAAPVTMGAVLARYRSQLGPEPRTNWLQSFDRADVPLYASPFLCTGTPRRCFDARFDAPPAEPREATDAATPWGEHAPLGVRLGSGVTVRAGGKHYRLCLRPHVRDGAELLVHDLTQGEELERRFAGLSGQPVVLRWVRLAEGVAEVDVSDGRGTVGRRLLALRGPMTVARATTCADVP